MTPEEKNGFSAQYLQRMLRESYTEGLEKGLTIVEQKHVDMCPYEIKTKIGAEVDSKGNIKPSAEIVISRRLENDNTIFENIKVDLEFGIENVIASIQEMMQSRERV